MTTNPLDEIATSENIDAVYAKVPKEVTDADFRLLIEYHRQERCYWLDKQDGKGKSE